MGSSWTLSGWGWAEIIASISALIAVVAMVVAIAQWIFAKRSAREAKRQADATLGEVDPLTP